MTIRLLPEPHYYVIYKYNQKKNEHVPVTGRRRGTAAFYYVGRMATYADITLAAKRIKDRYKYLNVVVLDWKEVFPDDDEEQPPSEGDF